MSLLAAVLGSAMDAIVAVGEGDRVELFNAAAERMFGVSAQEMTGQTVSRLMHRDYMDAYRQAIARLTGIGVGNAALAGSWPVIARRADGALFAAEASIARASVEGRDVHVLVIRDVSQQKRASDALRESEARFRSLAGNLEQRVAERTAELSAAKEELEAFSYSVAHDLRAPLRAINAFAARLGTLCGEAIGDAGRDYVGRLQGSCRRLDRMIADLLEVARSCNQSAASEEVDLDALARSVAEEQIASATRPAKLVVGKLPRVLGESAPLRQVLHNLIANAVKFSAKRECPEVEISCVSGADGIIVSVRDNGAGFDMEYAESLFEVFRRLHDGSEFEGTGIGLAIVRRIIRRHGGRVWGTGSVDGGATFSFSLPVERLLAQGEHA
jgi:PAS domain S-box-containing protein